ncbi:hypothetical protein ACJJIF_21310 [Microbulbifer sp. SSSA002]|uniref:hypothetical protein n=1 Tax=Microbulbifer sp. SSSA002 TaxID=3243376 RepID=UPI0040391583
MKVRSLIKITEGKDRGIHLTFFRPTLSIPYAAEDKDHAIEVARNFCSDTIDREGRPWIDFWKKDGGDISCPEGFVKLPIDLWCCKFTDDPCNLQAKINVNNEAGFNAGCHAEENRKKVIFSTVKNEKYDGFHHIPGRYLCVACERNGGKKESFFYHYPWEFAELDVAIGRSYQETRRILAAMDLPSNYVSCPICASCCHAEALKISPDLEEQLKVLEFNVSFRS